MVVMHQHKFTVSGSRTGHRSCVCGVSIDEECLNGHPRSEGYLNKRNVWVCRTCLREKSKKWRETQMTPEQHEKIKTNMRESANARHKEYRDMCYVAYGGKCVCCGESEVLFLTLDHVNSDGAAHRVELGGKTGRTSGTMRTYRWAIKNNFPDTLQLLCFNCNCGRFRNGGVCPHEGVVPNVSN